MERRGYRLGRSGGRSQPHDRPNLLGWSARTEEERSLTLDMFFCTGKQSDGTRAESAESIRAGQKQRRLHALGRSASRRLSRGRLELIWRSVSFAPQICGGSWQLRSPGSEQRTDVQRKAHSWRRRHSILRGQEIAPVCGEWFAWTGRVTQRRSVSQSRSGHQAQIISRGRYHPKEGAPH